MGVSSAGVHLPLHRIDGKRAREAGLARGFESLRVPGWDEDALTMAVEAGLELGEAVEGADRVRLFADDVEQPGLAARALGLDVPVTVTEGKPGLVAELAAGAEREEVWLAAGASTGGAGVAFRLEEGRGVGVEASTTRASGPLGSSPPVHKAVQALAEPDLEARARPGVARGLEADRFGRTVGDAGPAGAGLELAAHWADKTDPVVVGEGAEGQAVAVRLGEGSVDVSGLAGRSVALEVQAYRRRERADPEPWSEASQGAYVSREVYDADPERRYGARQRSPGEVAARTTIQAGPPGEFARQHEASGPYDVVIVELDDGGREIGQAAVPEGELAIGDRVEPVLRKVFSMEDQTRYGLKWRPERAE